MKRVIFFGHGPSYLVYEKILDKCKWIDEKYCISQTSAFKKEEIKIFGKNNYTSLEEVKISNAKEYKVNPKFIDSDKRRFSRKTGVFRDNYYESIYLEINNIFNSFKPNLIIFSKFIEVPDGLILHKIAKEKKILSVVPHSLRFLGGSIFSDSPYEGEINYQIENLKIKDFKVKKGFHIKLFDEIYPKPKTQKSFGKRFIRFFKLIFYRPKNFTIGLVLWKLEEFIKYREFKKIINTFYYQKIAFKTKLNQKYVFYPLHVSPEASINIPSPYYKDQIRAIDLIRYNLPPGYLLFVKEHPVGFYRRDRKFYKEIIKKSRVRVIHNKVSTNELILNAKCVISITGTACLEAFLWGIPSITISNSFFSNFLLNKLEDLKNENLTSPSTNQINRALSIIELNSNNFINSTPDYYNVTEKNNMNIFILSLEKFLKSRNYI